MNSRTEPNVFLSLRRDRKFLVQTNSSYVFYNACCDCKEQKGFCGERHSRRFPTSRNETKDFVNPRIRKDEEYKCHNQSQFQRKTPSNFFRRAKFGFHRLSRVLVQVFVSQREIIKIFRILRHFDMKETQFSLWYVLLFSWVSYFFGTSSRKSNLQTLLRVARVKFFNIDRVSRALVILELCGIFSTFREMTNSGVTHGAKMFGS